MVICSRCFRPLQSAPALPSHRQSHSIRETLMYFTCALIGTMDRTYFSTIQAMLRAIWFNSWKATAGDIQRQPHRRCAFTARFHDCWRVEKGLTWLRPTPAGNRAPGFETHARFERKLAALELERVQRMIAIFTHTLKMKVALDLQKEGSTWNSLDEDHKILRSLLNNNNNKKNP